MGILPLPQYHWPALKIIQLYDTELSILVRKRLNSVCLSGGFDIRRPRSMKASVTDF
jgi:hypothetical protein